MSARQDKTEAMRIASQAGLELGWPESCDEFLAAMFTTDETSAVRIAAHLTRSFDPATAARALSIAQARRPDDAAITDIVDKAVAEWLVAGLEHELASREAQAANCFNAARRCRPASVEASRAIERLNLPNLGPMRDAFANRDFTAAADYAEAATRIDHDCVEAWRVAARSLFSMGKSVEALAAFRRCAELDASDARTWLALGIALNQANDRVAALGAFRQARALGDAQVARETETIVVALFPALIDDAGAAEDGGRLGEAWRLYEAAAEIRPIDSAIVALQRKLLRRTREEIRVLWEVKSADIVPLCRTVLRFSPHDRQILTMLARMSMTTRNYADALPIWEELCASDPDNGHLHLQIARCCRALNLADRGIAAANSARRLDPNLHEATEIEHALRGA